MSSKKFLLLFARLCIGAVFLVNIQAGFDFFLHPQNYTSAYELAGIPGEVSVAGVGLLFLMWNVPYAFALWNPLKFRISLIQANLMQLIGVVGETFILFRVSAVDHLVLVSSIQRFIIFDIVGLLLLIIAWILTKLAIKK